LSLVCIDQEEEVVEEEEEKKTYLDGFAMAGELARGRGWRSPGGGRRGTGGARRRRGEREGGASVRERERSVGDHRETEMRRSCATEERRLASPVLIGEVRCGPYIQR